MMKKTFALVQGGNDAFIQATWDFSKYSLVAIDKILFSHSMAKPADTFAYGFQISIFSKTQLEQMNAPGMEFRYFKRFNGIDLSNDSNFIQLYPAIIIEAREGKIYIGYDTDNTVATNTAYITIWFRTLLRSRSKPFKK